jgi:hypothetical protein
MTEHTEERKAKIAKGREEYLATLTDDQRGALTIKARTKFVENNSGTYKLISPRGEEIEVTNLKQFCRDNGLDSANMRKVVIGKANQHKGWTGKEIK